MIEIWKDINGYEGLYQVSSLGQIRSLDREVYNTRGFFRHVKGAILSLLNVGNGYLRIVLYKERIGKRCQVHRLVAEAFIPNPDNKPTVNHIDSNRANNIVENLEWATHSENSIHGAEKGKCSIKNGRKIYFRKYSREQLLETNVLVLENKLSFKEISIKTDVQLSTVYDISRNKLKKINYI